MNKTIETQSNILIQKASKIAYYVAISAFTLIISFNQIDYIKNKYYFLIAIDAITMTVAWLFFILYRKKIIRFRLCGGVLAYLTFTDMTVSVFYFYYHSISFTNNFLVYTIIFCANIIMVGFCAGRIHSFIAGAYYSVSFAALLYISKDIFLTDNAFVLIATVIAFSIGISGFLYLLEKVHQEDIALKEELHANETLLVKERSDKLKLELEAKQKELTTKTLYLLKFVENNNSFVNQLNLLKSEIKSNGLKRFNSIIFEHKVTHYDNYWKEFETCFQEVHKEFYKKLQLNYPELSPAERRLAALIRLDLSTKQIADITLINIHSVEVARSRLRKKLGLEAQSNLKDFLVAY